MPLFKCSVSFDIRDIDTMRHNNGKFSRQMRAIDGCGALQFMVGYFPKGATESLVGQSASNTPTIGLHFIGPRSDCDIAVRSIGVLTVNQGVETLRNSSLPPSSCARCSGVYLHKLPLPTSVAKFRAKHYIINESVVRFEMCFEISKSSFDVVSGMPNPEKAFVANEQSISPVARCLFDSITRSTPRSSPDVSPSSTDSSNSGQSTASACSANFTLISSDDDEFKVHADVLANSQSSFFRRFYAQLKTPASSTRGVHSLAQLTSAQLHEVLRVIYLGMAPKNLSGNLLDMARAAHFLGMGDLKKLCDYEMVKKLQESAFSHSDIDTHDIVRLCCGAFDQRAAFDEKVLECALNVLMDRHDDLTGDLVKQLRDLYIDAGNKRTLFNVLCEFSMQTQSERVKKYIA